MPCCEWKDLVWEKKMRREEMDNFFQVLSKIREELSFAQETNGTIDIEGNVILAVEAAKILEPLFKAWTDHVGYEIFLKEAAARGKKRAG